MLFKGKVYLFGDNIDTDQIYPGRYLELSEYKEIARYAMEGCRPGFADCFEQGGIIIAKRNFGCGSSREHAVIALKILGVSAIIAESFARIFYRNAINIGLPILECQDDLYRTLQEQDLLRVDLDRGLIQEIESGNEHQAAPFPPFMQEIIRLGGLVEYVQKRLRETG